MLRGEEGRVNTAHNLHCMFLCMQNIACSNEAPCATHYMQMADRASMWQHGARCLVHPTKGAGKRCSITHCILLCHKAWRWRCMQCVTSLRSEVRCAGTAQRPICVAFFHWRFTTRWYSRHPKRPSIPAILATPEKRNTSPSMLFDALRCNILMMCPVGGGWAGKNPWPGVGFYFFTGLR